MCFYTLTTKFKREIKETIHLPLQKQQEIPVAVKLLSRVRLFVTPGTVACQTPLSVGFSMQEYWSGLPFLPNPGMEPTSPLSPALVGGFFTSATWVATKDQLTGPIPTLSRCASEMP